MRTHSKEAVATLLLSALLGFAVGCAKHSSDDTIAQAVQTKAAADPVAKDSAVTVTAKDGKVTLKGTVKSPDAQQRLYQIARQEPGVTAVDDETAVAPEQSQQGAQPEQTASAPPAPAPPPPPKPAPRPIVVPADTAITVTVDQALSSKDSQEGQTFLATVAQPVTVDGKTAIPKGASASGTVVTAKKKGKIKGEGQLALALTNITIRGKTYPIHTITLDSTVKGKGKRTAATTGGGAAGGALIGGLAGGGKGAGIGALVGGAGGLIGGAFTGNKQVEIKPETPLTFTLTQRLTLPPREASAE